MDTKLMAKIATFDEDGYFEVQMFTQREMTVEMSIRIDERRMGGRCEISLQGKGCGISPS